MSLPKKLSRQVGLEQPSVSASFDSGISSNGKATPKESHSFDNDRGYENPSVQRNRSLDDNSPKKTPDTLDPNLENPPDPLSTNYQNMDSISLTDSETPEFMEPHKPIKSVEVQNLKQNGPEKNYGNLLKPEGALEETMPDPSPELGPETTNGAVKFRDKHAETSPRRNPVSLPVHSLSSNDIELPARSKDSSNLGRMVTFSDPGSIDNTQNGLPNHGSPKVERQSILKKMTIPSPTSSPEISPDGTPEMDKKYGTALQEINPKNSLQSSNTEKRRRKLSKSISEETTFSTATIAQKFQDAIEERPHIRDIFLKSDIHGLPEWYEATSPSTKFIWTLILVSAIILMIYELHVAFNEFQENPILTTYSVQYEAEGLKMPKIYLCPMSATHEQAKYYWNVSQNWLDTHEVQDIFDSANFARDGDSSTILSQKNTLWESAHGVVQGEMSDCWRLKAKLNKGLRPSYTPADMEDYFMKVGYPSGVLFKECAFRTISFNCTDYITEVFDKDYGKCFLLNFDSFTQTTGGLGLSLVLDLETEYAYDKENPPLFDSVIMRIGSDEFQMTNEEKTQLSPGQYSIIRLSTTKYNLIERPRTIGAKQVCTKPEVGKRQLQILNVTYGTETCRLDCMMTAILKKCKCVMPMDRRYLQHRSIVNLGSDPFCYADQIKTCVRAVLAAKTDQDNDKKDLLNCYHSCKVPCEFDRFESVHSISRFPSTMFLTQAMGGKKRRKRSIHRNKIDNRRLKREETEYRDDDDEYTYLDSEEESEDTTQKTPTFKTGSEHNKRKSECADDDVAEVSSQDWLDYSVLDISFPSLQKIEIEQENSMTFTSFVSDIGGQVGLWIGASIITMEKFFVILCPIFYGYVTARIAHYRKTSNLSRSQSQGSTSSNA